jgi:hypothetical protein
MRNDEPYKIVYTARMPARNALVSAGFITTLVLLAGVDTGVNARRWSLPSAADASAAPAGHQQSNADTVATVQGTGQQTKGSSEPSILEVALGEGVPVQKQTLLSGNDRTAFFAWADVTDGSQTMQRIKSLVHGSFSNSLRDLIDETQSEPGKRPRDVLSFIDPAIHPERLLFARSENRIYEFHIAPGKEPIIDNILDALTD